MSVVTGQPGLGVGEGGLADQHVRPVRQREGRVTQPGVHDEGEALSRPRLAHLLGRHHPAAGLQTALALQAPDVGTGDAQGGEPVREHPPSVRLGQPVADGRRAVRQRPRLQPERRRADDRALPPDPPFAQVQHVPEQRRVAQPAEHLPAARRIAHLDRVRHPVQRHPRQHARQAEAMIAVQVGDADAGDLAGRDPGEQHLPLGSLARVEQQALVVPAQEVAVVIAAAGGRLARRAENNQLTVGHDIPQYAAHRQPRRSGARPGQAQAIRRGRTVAVTARGSRPGRCRRRGGPARRWPRSGCGRGPAARSRPPGSCRGGVSARWPG